jgi:hypothetical protein
MMILNNRVFMANDKPESGNSLTMLRHPISLCWLMVFLTAGALNAQQGTHVSARFAAVKGVVMVSTGGLGEKQVHKGDSVRSGTVITCGAESGASLKPLPTLHVVIYPDTKVRFDGADTNSEGGGSVMCTILAGKALFHMDQAPQGPEGTPKETQPAIKVTVVTDEGVIVNKMGGPPEANDGTQPTDKTTQQITGATWTVQHDEGRTVVAVGEGLSQVSIGKGAAASGGDVGGQVKVPQGSVIWLFNRGGKIEADLVDTQTGKVTNLTGGSPSGGSDLLAQSKQQLVTPSSSGTTTTIGGTPTNTPGTTPTNPSSNPDLSTPQKPLPVVSADTP